MSTNFYVKLHGCKSDCGHCKRATVLHVGKRSGGGRNEDGEWTLRWTFCWHTEYDLLDDYTGDNVLNDDVKEIKDWETWKNVLTNLAHYSAVFVDEYDAIVDVDDFIAQVEAKTSYSVTSDDVLRASPWGAQHERDYVIYDDNGFRFMRGEWS